MINSRPKTSTFISLLIFLGVSFALLGIQIAVIIIDPLPTWFNYLIVLILTPIVLFVTYRVIFRYKKISMGGQLIEVRYPFLGIHQKYSLREVAYWSESIVKTSKSSNYKELEVKFTDGRIIQTGHREYTEYEKMVTYLAKKIPTFKKFN